MKKQRSKQFNKHTIFSYQQLILSKIKLHTNITSLVIFIVLVILIFFLIPEDNQADPKLKLKFYQKDEIINRIKQLQNVTKITTTTTTIKPTLNPRYKNLGVEGNKHPTSEQRENELSKMYKEALDKLADTKKSESDLLAKIDDLREVISKQRKVIMKQGLRRNKTRYDSGKHKAIKNIVFEKWEDEKEERKNTTTTILETTSASSLLSTNITSTSPDNLLTKIN